MFKKTTSLTIDDDVIDRAKKMGINMSKVAEQAFRDKLNLKDVVIDQSIDKCEFCDKEDRKATRDDLEGLTWLYPDERWICENCLKHKMRLAAT